jgi:hypothetical protein
MSVAFDGIDVGASILVNKAYALVNGVMLVTLLFEISVRSPTITGDRSARFDPRIYNGLQSFGGCIRNGNEKHYTGIALYTTKTPTAP